MRTLFKTVGLLVVILIVTIAGFVLWYGREQNIDFTSYLRTPLNTCNGEVEVNTIEYETLLDWLSNNQSGWTNNPATFAPGYFYRSDEITVSVLDNFVVINFLADGEWSQVQKSANTDAIRNECVGNS
ncbi:hypothetical protein [Alteromonas sp. W364]|uniref:hypothetical protein n=1 Tax=Alteromonas sp. W364 TaxID=3075610 RepID=UPI0028873BCB|nr:hypothetical protein [Alteromonas sp. W364]MDT0630087.1 hypothetical protein [Alteromonas sp. W364]